MQSDLAIVILNYNTCHLLNTYLPSVVKHSKDCRIIFVDNASKDESVKFVRENYPQIEVIQLEENFGFTGGYNRALKQINAKYYCLLNTDVEVTENWIQPIINLMESDETIAVCQPKLLSFLEKNKFEYAGAAGGYLDKFGYPLCRGRVLKELETDNGQYDSPKDVFWATGACLLVRSSVYKELGGLDDRFFAHMEEIDLCWRMQLSGWKVTVVPSSVVYHVGGGTLPATSPFKLFLNFRNNRLMLSNNLAKTYALQFLAKGLSIEKAARKGHCKAQRMLFVRGSLDMLSAMVYLLTGKTACFKAVLKARKEAKLLERKTDVSHIEAYLQLHGAKASVAGIYNRWIILRSVIKGKGIFKEIESEVI